MTRLLQLIILLLLPAALAAMPVDEVPNVHLQDSTQFVSNPSGVLSQADVRSLNEKIRSLRRATTAELCVVVVDRLDSDYTPEEFATGLFEKWGIGKKDKDNGVLVLVSVDDRAAQIRTGYGVEGALPDVLMGRLLRNEMFPRFREGDYAGGINAAVDGIDTLLRDPSVAQEILSKQKNDAAADDEDDFFGGYLALCGVAAAIMLILVIWRITSTRRLDDVSRWRSLSSLSQIALVVSCFTLGMGLPAFFLAYWWMHHVRRHRRNCPRCGTRMQLVDEVHDNDYLTPSQDLEERLNSVDYDVWRCPSCAQTEILPYINRTSPYKECPRCHVRALAVTDRRILREPTVRTEGEGVDISVCRNCGNRTEKRFKIDKKPDPAAAVAAGAILGGMSGGRSSGGGGGFGGGSWGGGLTGGGGAGGNW